MREMVLRLKSGRGESEISVLKGVFGASLGVRRSRIALGRSNGVLVS